MKQHKKIAVKWLFSIALVAFIGVAFAPRSEITPRVARATWRDVSTPTPLAPPPLVFVPLEQLNPFPTLSAANTTRTPPRATLRARPHFPEPHAQAVAPDSLISIVFEMPMNAASVEKRFHVTRADTGAAVAGYFEWQAKMAVFYPVPLLESNASYRVVLAAGAQSADGTATLRDKIEWTFATGELFAVPLNRE
ncbi:hypothetical protein FBQ82_02295 [Anaerolineae bacterium CFX7]|nr:hypothetical protein [Anaerolineae bacterium CFX7]